MGRCPSKVNEFGDMAVDSLKIGGVEVEGAGGLTLVGVTASAAEINILDGVTATASEINKLDGAGAVVASGTQHAHVADAATNLANDANGTAIAAAVNANSTKINAMLAALEAFGINASA
jgi:hypothetical protein